jgi:hypothetical protein
MQGKVPSIKYTYFIPNMQSEGNFSHRFLLKVNIHCYTMYSFDQQCKSCIEKGKNNTVDLLS